MALTNETVEKLFRKGEYGELVRAAPRHPAGLRALEPKSQVLVAEALTIFGDNRAALEALASIPKSALLNQGINARAHIVRGLICAAEGRHTEGAEHCRAALRAADESGDLEAAAWAQLRLLRMLAGTLSGGHLQDTVREARQRAIRAGDVHVTSYLHQSIAVVEGQGGHLSESRRHCEIAESLLLGAPNAWLTAGNLMNRCSVSGLDCDAQGAEKHLSNLRAVLERSPLSRAAASAEVLRGQLLFLQGRFGESTAVATGALESEAIHGQARLAALDTVSRCALAEGDLESCDTAVDALRQLEPPDRSEVSTYYGRLAAITRARLMLKRGEARQAVRFLKDAEANARDTKDLSFTGSVHITTAQALLRCGDAAGAARRLLTASRLGVASLRELQGAFYFAASEVTADHDVARQLAERADRLWAVQGIVSTKLEMQSDRPERGTPREEAQSGTAVVVDSRTCAVEAMAGAVDLAQYPRLFGQEVATAIRALTGAEATVVDTRDTSPQPRTSADRVVMPIGAHDGTQFHLVCPVPSDAGRTLQLASLLRVAQAALDAQKHYAAEQAKAALWPANEFEVEGGGVFISDEMRSLLTIARKVAATNVPVLITGETGTGKEVLARIIHASSARPKAPLVPFNCASTPKDMLDSQLFGHRRGAFTGAIETFPGVIRAATGGTLFLDEIGDMGLDVQPKLLRFLETGEVHPVGEAHPVRTDVRIIAATNADLSTMVSQGRFREDLFYRLDIVRLSIPPLRERRIEIPSLVDHFLQKFGRDYGKPGVRFSEEAIEYLTLYRWPGNVRQLANEMRRVVALAEPGAVLTPHALSHEVQASRRTIPASQRQADPSEIVIRLDQPMPAATEQLERAMIAFALKHCGGHIETTADRLGLSRKGLYLKRHRFGIEPPPAIGVQDPETPVGVEVTPG